MTMNLDALYSELTLKTDAKLALVVLDGLGDLATAAQNELTPLEAAKTPNLDALVSAGVAQGRMIPVAPGITPGSGPGHLGLFGYDPLEFQVGRGVIEALGLGLALRSGDVAARANFCTIDNKGIVTDRRAGRILQSGLAGHCQEKAGERHSASRHRASTGDSNIRGALQTEGRLHRGLSDVQRFGATGGHAEARRVANHRPAIRALPRRIRQL